MSVPFASEGCAAEVWDAGDLGCGELVLELRGRLRAMPGRILRVIARDPGAPQDLPSWCRMTGNALVREDPATHSFWIEARKVESAAASIPVSPAMSGVAPNPAIGVDDVYSPRVFELAELAPPDTTLQGADATASARSKLCGSTIDVDVSVGDGRVTAYAHRLKACLFGRASASVVARNIVGAPVDDVLKAGADMRAMLQGKGAPPEGRWQDLGALAPLTVLKARHASALLVFVALDKALAQTSGPAAR